VALDDGDDVALEGGTETADQELLRQLWLVIAGPSWKKI
jgi:hypothetical protein